MENHFSLSKKSFSGSNGSGIPFEKSNEQKLGFAINLHCQPRVILIDSSLMINGILILFFLSCVAISQAQEISMYQVGRDKVQINNRLNQGVNITLGNQNYALGPNQSINAPFNLATYNVETSTIRIYQDRYSLHLDSVNAVERADRKNDLLNSYESLMLGTIVLFGKKCNWDLFFISVRLLGLNKEMPYLDRFYSYYLGNIGEIGVTCSQRTDAALLAIKQTRLDFEDGIKSQLKTDLTIIEKKSSSLINKTYACSRLLPKRVKSTVDFIAYMPYINLRKFQDVPYEMGSYRAEDKVLQRVPFSKFPSFGGRMSFNFYSQGKTDRSLGSFTYMPFDYFRSKIFYKDVPDSLLNAGKAVSFGFYSAGLGYGYRSNNLSIINVDFGIIFNTVYYHTMDTLTHNVISKNISKEPFSGRAAYCNFGCKYQIAKGIQAYAAYYSTFAYSITRHMKSPIPNFWSLNLGVTMVLGKTKSYQF